MPDHHLTYPPAHGAALATPSGGKAVGFPGMLLLLFAIGPTSFQIFLPSLPAIARGFAVAPGVAQLALSLSMLGMAAATLAYGRLADRFGRRPVLLAGMALLVAGSLACMAAPSIELLIAGRVVQAAGGAAGMVVGRAIVLDVHGPERSARVLAGLLAAMMIAPVLATPVGGFLNDQIGWRANFAVLAMLGAGLLAALWWRLPETGRDHDPSAPVHLLADYAELLRSRAFAGFALQGACAMAAFMAFTTGAPYVLTETKGLSATAVGLWFTAVSAGFAGGSLLASRLPDGVPLGLRARAGSLLALAAAVAALLLTWGSGWSTAALVGPVALLAFATGITMPASQAGAMAAVPKLSGTASGLSGFAGTLLAAGATQAVGALSDGTPHAVTIAMVALSAVALGAATVACRAARG